MTLCDPKHKRCNHGNSERPSFVRQESRGVAGEGYQKTLRRKQHLWGRHHSANLWAGTVSSSVVARMGKLSNWQPTLTRGVFKCAPLLTHTPNGRRGLSPEPSGQVLLGVPPLGSGYLLPRFPSCFGSSKLYSASSVFAVCLHTPLASNQVLKLHTVHLADDSTSNQHAGTIVDGMAGATATQTGNCWLCCRGFNSPTFRFFAPRAWIPHTFAGNLRHLTTSLSGADACCTYTKLFGR